jgi:hypothetical protein
MPFATKGDVRRSGNFAVDMIGTEDLLITLADAFLPRSELVKALEGGIKEVAEKTKTKLQSITPRSKKGNTSRKKGEPPMADSYKIQFKQNKKFKHTARVYSNRFYGRFVEYGHGGPAPATKKEFLRPAERYATKIMKPILERRINAALAKVF